MLQSRCRFKKARRAGDRYRVRPLRFFKHRREVCFLFGRKVLRYHVCSRCQNLRGLIQICCRVLPQSHLECKVKVLIILVYTFVGELLCLSAPAPFLESSSDGHKIAWLGRAVFEESLSQRTDRLVLSAEPRVRFGRLHHPLRIVICELV